MVRTPFRLRGEWRYSQKALNEFHRRGETVQRKGDKFKPYYINNEDRRKAVKTLWVRSSYDVGTNEDGNAEIHALFGDDVFSFPKPTALVRKIIELIGSPSSLVVDFFAGPGTTGDAVMHLNAADGGTRRYLLVQLPERLDPANEQQRIAAAACDALGQPRVLAEITKERLRRGAARIRRDHPGTAADLGFRVYTLASSNLRAWAPGEDLAADLIAAADNLVPGRSEEDLLTELLLTQGLDLTAPMLTETIAGAAVHALGGGALVVCLAPVAAAQAEALADGIADWIERLAPAAATTVFFRDAGFADDVGKANVAAILAQRLDGRLLKVGSL